MPRATHKYKTFPLVFPTMYPEEGIAITEIAATTSNIEVVVTVPECRNDNQHVHHPHSDHMSSPRHQRLSQSRSPRHRSPSVTPRRDRSRSPECSRPRGRSAASDRHDSTESRFIKEIARSAARAAVAKMKDREYRRNRGDVPIKLDQETKEALRVNINHVIYHFILY